MKDILKVIQILLGLLPMIQDIIEFLSGLREVRRVSGDEVARQLARDSAQIGSLWKAHLKNTRPNETEVKPEGENLPNN